MELHSMKYKRGGGIMTEQPDLEGEKGIKYLESKRNALDGIEKDEPKSALNNVYNILNYLEVPRPASEEDVEKIMRLGCTIISKLLRSFGEYYPIVENFDVVKAQGFKFFMDRVASFSEKLGEIPDMIPAKPSVTYFDLSILDRAKQEITSLIKTGGDIGPELKSKTADLINLLENMPEIPSDLRQKSAFFTQFTQFSENMIDLLEIMTFIKNDVIALDFFFDEQLNLLNTGKEFLETLKNESDDILRKITVKTTAVIYSLSKKAPRNRRGEYKAAYKRILKEMLPKLGDRSLKKDIKQNIKYYTNRDPLDILREFTDELGNVLHTVKRTSSSISKLIHDCIEASGKILNAFVLASHEAKVVLNHYKELFAHVSSEMMKFDQVAFRNIINKNNAAFDAVSNRILLAESDVSKMMDSVISNRKTLDILNGFYKNVHEIERELERRKNKLDEAIKLGTLVAIIEKLGLSSGEILSVAQLIFDFFNRDFNNIYEIYRNIISTIQNLRRKV